jgi:predicted DNA-binding transcriptional regulator YafY
MVETSARLLRLLSLLQERRFWSGAALAEALEITPRSVRRDVERLRSLGYPVHATAGTGGGYQLGAGRDLPPLPLDDEEAVAVAVGLHAAMTGPVRGLEEAAVRALARLEQVLPVRLRRKVQALQAVSVPLAGGARPIDGHVLSVIANACRDTEVTHFDYQAREGAVSERTVEPYRLVHSSQRWYLLAFDLGRQAWRTFRVDRITAPRAAQRFSPRRLPAEDVAAYVSQAVSTDVYEVRAQVRVHAPRAEVEQRLSGLAARVVSQRGGVCVVHTGARSVEALAFHLCMTGLEFEVQAPTELLSHLRDFTARLQRATRLTGSSTAATPRG